MPTDAALLADGTADAFVVCASDTGRRSVPGCGSLAQLVTGVVESDGRDPTAICAAAMRRGRTAPPLVACTNTGDGEVEIFPGWTSAICERLDLVPLPSSYCEAARRFAAFRGDVGAVFLAGCVTEADGRRILRAALERHGLGG